MTTPISDCQVRDPRIRRTRKLLQGALDTLLRSKSFEDISVQDITEVATVNRATFYDHYTDKFALLEALVAGGFHEFLDERKLLYNVGCPAALGAVILATCDYLTQVHAGGDCVRQSAFEPLMDAAIAKAIQRLLLRGLEHAEQMSEAGPDLVAAAASAAICAAVKQWLAMKNRPSAQAIVPQIQLLVLPMLEAGFTAGSRVAAAAHPHE